MATSLAGGDGLARRAERIRRLMSRTAMIKSVEAYPVMALPPTVTVVNGTSGAQPYNVRISAETASGRDPAALYTLFGGTIFTQSGGWRAKPVTLPAGFPPQYFNARLAFMTDAPLVEAMVVLSATMGYRVLVDGQYVSLTPTMVTNGGFNRLTIDFGGVRRWRRIDIEGGSDAIFDGIYIDSASTVEKIDTASVYRVASFGDSTSASTNAGFAADGWNVWAGKLLGGVDVDVVQMSLGSTGVITAGQYYNGSAHIDDLDGQAYDEVWIGFGINDAIRSGASFTGSIAGDVLTVTAVASGEMRTGPGGVISGTGVIAGTQIVRSLTGNPTGVGTYRLDRSYDTPVPSAAMTGTAITAADVTAAYLAFYQAVRAKLPYAVIVQFGVSRPDSGNATATEGAMRAAFDAWADKNSGFVPLQQVYPKLYRGLSTDTTTGNARIYFSASDNTHEQKAGHFYRAGYSAERRRGLRFGWDVA